MANNITMQFDLVSPERRLASLEVTAVQIPGADGDLTAMPGHAPVITNLRPGILKVESPSGNTDYVVTGGFAEIVGGLSDLAENDKKSLGKVYVSGKKVAVANVWEGYPPRMQATATFLHDLHIFPRFLQESEPNARTHARTN